MGNSLLELLDVEVLCRVPRVTPERVRGFVDAIVDDEVVVVRERPHAGPDAGHPRSVGVVPRLGEEVMEEVGFRIAVVGIQFSRRHPEHVRSGGDGEGGFEC